MPPTSVGLTRTRSLDVGNVVYHPALLCTNPINEVVPPPVKVVTPVTPVTWLVDPPQVPTLRTQTCALETFTRSLSRQFVVVLWVQVAPATESFTPKKYWVSELVLSTVL